MIALSLTSEEISVVKQTNNTSDKRKNELPDDVLDSVAGGTDLFKDPKQRSPGYDNDGPVPK